MNLGGNIPSENSQEIEMPDLQGAKSGGERIRGGAGLIARRNNFLSILHHPVETRSKEGRPLKTSELTQTGNPVGRSLSKSAPHGVSLEKGPGEKQENNAVYVVTFEDSRHMPFGGYDIKKPNTKGMGKRGDTWKGSSRRINVTDNNGQGGCPPKTFKRRPFCIFLRWRDRRASFLQGGDRPDKAAPPKRGVKDQRPHC